MSKLGDSFFLVIEGLDGSGKTEISRRLKRILQQTHKNDVILTFEPHDPSSAGLFIRQVLTHKLKNVTPRTLALAFALNRADHTNRIINPFLKSGDHHIVVCDRYYLSSLVYQSNEELPIEEVMLLNREARQPDLTLFLNASAKTCYERMRKRPEDKELFERNLADTREKYRRAIEFLRKEGDRIVEINADNDFEVVLNEILDKLVENAPNWFLLQRPLLEEPALDVFSLNGISESAAKIQTIISRFSDRWEMGGALGSSSQFRQKLLELKEAVEIEVDWLSYDDLGLLFIGYLQRLGYKFNERLPWTETCAYELEFKMPMELTQRGTALLLTEAQRYDVVTKKIQSLFEQTDDFGDIRHLSDFMFVLDAAPAKQVERSYEREGSSSNLSPSIRIMHRIPEIADFVLVDILVNYYDQYAITLRRNPELYDEIAHFVDEHGLRPYWNIALAHLSERGF